MNITDKINKHCEIEGVLPITLDKLGQLRNSPDESLPTLQHKQVDSDKLQKRAKSKYLAKALAIKLIEYNPNSVLFPAYHRSLTCGDVIVQEGGELKSHYCKTRWCPVCNRIRTAVYINKYDPVLSEWKESHFLTLTVRNVTPTDLSQTVDRMQGEFTKIKDILRKRGVKLVGIRKLEVTYSQERGYHPHYHIILYNREQAEMVLTEWLKRFPKDTLSIAQDIRPADAGSTKELFKYMTKMTAKGSDHIDPVMLDVIFRALKGRRVLQTFGFIAPKVDDSDFVEEATVKVDDQELFVKRYFIWKQEMADWVDDETGECLSGYVPSARRKQFVDRIMKE